MKIMLLIKKAMLCIIAIALVLPALPVHAGDAETTTFIVDTTEDLIDDMPNGICSAGAPTGGPCSLRAAFFEAKTILGVGNNLIIKVPEGHYKLTVTEDTGYDPYFGDLDLDSLDAPTERWVIIEGDGPNKTLIDANDIGRAIEIGENYNVTISNLQITNGTVKAVGNGGAEGAGILVQNALGLELNHVWMTYNRVHKSSNPDSSASGGAIYSLATPITIRYSSFDNNWAESGSVIYLVGDEAVNLNIYASSFFFNKATTGPTVASLSPLMMINSSVFSNDEGEGSLWAFYDIHIQNSTLVSQGKGNNIFYYGKLYLRNSILMAPPDTNGEVGENCVALVPSHLSEEIEPEVFSEGGNVFSDNSCEPNSDISDIVVPWEEAGVGNIGISDGGILQALPLLPESPAINRRFESCQATMIPLDVPVDMVLGLDQFSRPRGLFCDSGALGSEKTYQFFPITERK